MIYKITLLIVIFVLSLNSASGFLGLFDENPQWLILERVEAGARLYTGLTPVSVANDVNVIALNILADSDWNGLLDGFEGTDLNRTVLARCSGDANSVWTSVNNCQDITNFDAAAAGGDDTFSVLSPVIPWVDVNVSDDITLTNITQITNRAFTNITDRNFSLLSLDDNSSFDDRYLPHLLRSYTGISPITADNDNNLLGLNVTPTTDWNGTFDGNDSTFFIDWNNSVNRLFSLLTLDDNSSFDGRYISGLFEGANIDLNSNSGDILIRFDDLNFLDTENRWNRNQLMFSTVAIIFRDLGQFINSGTAGRLDLGGASEVEITAPIIDLDSSNAVTIRNDLNLFTGKASLFDVNVGSGTIEVNGVTYFIDADLNLNAITAGCGAAEFLGGDGTCQTGGGGADVNGTDIAPNFVTVSTDVNVTEHLIVDGNITVGGIILGNDIGVRVFNSVDIVTSPGAGGNILTFDSESWDTNDMHNDTNSSRLTANIAGTYLIIGNVTWEFNASRYRRLTILLNGTTQIARNLASAETGTSGKPTQVITTMYQLVAGDYVELRGAQTIGADLNIVAALEYSPVFSMQRLVGT